MTSVPVSAGTKSIFLGTGQTVTATDTEVSGSFSDTLKNQKNDNEAGKMEINKSRENVSTEKPKPERKIRPAETKEESAEEVISKAETASQSMAEQMVKTTAEELDISEEEVYQVLGSLGMTPVDLLNIDNLQEVVLTAAGGSDRFSLITDEGLFASYKNLTNVLTELINEIAGDSGLSAEQVKDIFANIGSQVEETDELQSYNPESSMETSAYAEAVKSELPQAKEMLNMSTMMQNEGAMARQGEGLEEGTKVLLDRSLSDRGLSDRTRQEENQHLGNENNQSFFTENFANRQFAEEVTTKLGETTNVFDADTEMILNQITDYMKSQVVDGVSELEMQLHPENLGTLHVKLTSKEGMVTAQFVAQNEVVKTALESQMIQLKETFREQGISVEAIEVMVESHRFDENLNRNNNGSMQEDNRQPARNRNRRIRLNSLSEDEELTKEEALAAEIMRSNGNTVDYSA